MFCSYKVYLLTEGGKRRENVELATPSVYHLLESEPKRGGKRPTSSDLISLPSVSPRKKKERKGEGERKRKGKGE